MTANGLLRGLSWPCIQEFAGLDPNGTGEVSVHFYTSSATLYRIKMSLA